MRFLSRSTAYRITAFLFAALFFGSASPSFAQAPDPWSNSLEQAKSRAAAEQKNILLNFSGSDWCGPCIKLKKDILSSPVFLDYSATHLVLLNADFPRLKKNAQEKALKEQNEKLAERFNKEGVFPYTVLLSKDLEVLKVWAGLPELTADEFTNQLMALDHAGN